MGIGDLLPGRLADSLRRLGCTPAEAAALAVLALGSVLVVALLWRDTTADSAASPAPAGVVLSSDPALGPAERSPAALAPPGAPEPSATAPTALVVHVAGLVVRPGVYTLPAGARVGDAVTAAGGALPGAVLDGLNLARPLSDGEQLLVPDEAAAAPPASGPAPSTSPAPTGTPSVPSASEAPPPLNLNHATAAELEQLPEVGPVLAARIITHRDQIGGFADVAALRDVPGIGEKTFQALAPLVTV